MMKRTKKNLIDMVRKIQTIRPKEEIGEDTIKVLKLMVKHYDERGGGYSQKVALKEAIRSLSQPIRLPGRKEIEALEEIIKVRNSKHKDSAIGKCTEMWKIAEIALSDVAGLNKKGE